jgi:hypothetical protein
MCYYIYNISGNFAYFLMMQLCLTGSYLKGFCKQRFKYKYRVPSVGIGVPVFGTVLLNISLLRKSFQ